MRKRLQDQENHESMVESTVDRQTSDEITQKHKKLVESVRPPIVTDQEHEDRQIAANRQIFVKKVLNMAKAKQPQATDFTEIVASGTQDGEYAVRVMLDSGEHIMVSKWACREEAERLELAINQVMIEYRTKRNAWEKEVNNAN